MESPLEVLSRAATMVQDNANDSRLTTKELPTTKWRRDRRMRAAPEYHLPHNIVTGLPSSPAAHSPSPSQNNSSPSPSQQKPLTESTNTTQIIESPLDMSVTSTTMKPRSPPPPYREPLPGSTFASLARPSVITQAPPKRDSNSLISNRENDNRSQESISMCDPVIDEHFRRSLGADYLVLFGNNNKINNKSSSSISPSSGSNSPKMSSSSLASGASSPALSTSPSLSIKPNSPTIESPTSPKQLTPTPAITTAATLNNSGATSLTTSHLTKREQKNQPKQQQQQQAHQINKQQKSPINNRRSPSPPPRTTTVMVTNDNSVAHSVDDHFAKALGDTWRKLQAKAKRDEED
ncbi:mucin-2 [Condylostylus longicornis]|uniref:mucin-2 n=1 Tax=Condylostylus longicornis TaxID=2530218 RepID=UPI00244DDDD0|nr:mucin-2 [Condylostylus longicornis]